MSYYRVSIERGVSMINIKAGMKIPAGHPYAEFIVTSVARNGWCRGYYESNTRYGIEAAMTSVRAHWMFDADTKYNIIPS